MTAVNGSLDVSARVATERPGQSQHQVHHFTDPKFRALFDWNVVPVFVWHQDGRVLDANDAYLRLAGASRDQLEAGTLRWHEVASIDNLQIDPATLAALFAGERDGSAFQRQFIRRQGSVVSLVAGCVLPERVDQGVAFAIDVTQRWRAEAALRDSEALVRWVFQSLYGYVAVIDRNGVIVDANDAWAQFVHGLGARSQPIHIGVNYLQLCERAAAVGDQTAAAALTGMRAVLNGQTQTYRLEYSSPSAEQELWFELRVLPLKRSEGGALAFHLDVTSQHQAQLEAQRLRNDLSHVTRVSIMGELTASVAHELNQPLTAILSNTQAALRMLKNRPEVPDEIREILEDIAADDRRAAEIIRKVRQLVKKDQFQLEPVELNKLVLDVSALLESDALIRQIKIQRELAPDLPLVRGDRVQLQQVLLNLMLNGLDAMRPAPGDVSRKLIVATHADAKWVRIRVTDVGIGIPPDRANLIFEPFFTTKQEGMGMGLSISRSIVTALGGRISGRNNADRGATFEVELPVIKGEQQ
jgi:PAS domain S-box-containing protein